MSLFDGTNFIGINADAYAPDQPLDAFGEALLRNDELWLLGNGNWFTHGFWRQRVAPDEAGGDRAYASAIKSYIFTAPFYVAPTLNELEIVICGRVNTSAPSPVDNEITIWAELAGVGEVSGVFTATADYAALRLTIPVRTRPANPFITQLRLAIKSQITGDTGEADGGGSTFFPGGLTPSIYPAEGWPSPSSTTLGEQATALPSGGIWDHILRGVDGVWMVSTALPAQLPLNGAPNFKTVHLSYLQMRGFALREVHTAELYPASEIRALIPLLGQTTSQHPIALLAAQRRPQLLSLGRPGDLDYSRCTGADLPEGYTTPFQWKAIAAGEGYATIHRQPLLLDEAACSIEVRILYIPIYVCPDYAGGKFEDLSGKDAAQALWTFYMGAFTYEDGSGDRVALEEASSTLALAHLPTDQSGVWPFLRQRRWAAGEFSDSSSGGVYDLPAAYEPGTERPTYKEGQLFGPDMALVQEAVIKLPMLNLPTDKAVCIELSAAYTGASIDFRTPTGASDPKDPDRVQIVVVGMSIWAHSAGAAGAHDEPAAFTGGKNIAAAAAIPSPLRYAVGQPVRAADWQALVDQANRLWARRGSRGIGRWFEEGSIHGEQWVTTSTTPTAISGVAGVNERLSNISGPGVMLHDVSPDRGAVRLYLEAHGRNIELVCEVYALDTGALLDTLTAAAADWELMGDVIELPAAAAHEGGSSANPKRGLILKLLANVPLSGVAQLSYWQIREEPITDPADLPGPP